MSLKKINISFLFLFALLFSFCGGTEAVDDTPELTTTSSTPTVQETTTTTTLLIVQDTNEEQCIADDNTSINLESNRAIQRFLNKYGFNAGDVDGYFGYQSTEALRKFQAFVGISPDGDLGPITKEAIKNWTGCEVQISSYTSPPTTSPDQSVNEENENTTTTTTSPSTTTTTVIETVNNTLDSSFGFLPSIGIDTNNLITIFKGVSNKSSVCGTPYYNNIPNDVLNYFTNGNTAQISILPSPFSESSNTAQISTNLSNKFEVEIIGNGDNEFKFYFIPPFSNEIISLNPDEVIVTAGKTIAIFNKSNLTSGYWFFAFAENSSGKIIKSSSPREFNNGNVSLQTYSGSVETEILNFNINGRNVGGGEALSTNDSISISYITKGSYDEKPVTPSDIQKVDNVITLLNNDQADAGDLLVINNEVMKVLSKDNNSKYTVQRGFNNTEPRKHLTGASVKKIKNPESNRVNSSFAYVVIRSESGKKYQLILDGEVTSHSFNLSGCPNDRYLFEEIKSFSWREQGKSVVASNSIKNPTGSIFNKSFIVSESNNAYSPPTLKSTDPDTGIFANSGPRNINTTAGSEVVFNFSGLQKGSSDLQFVEIKFQMLPTTGSSKPSTSRSIFFPINEDVEFKINIDSVISSKAFKSTEWESGYRYIFSELSVYDQLSKTIFKNNGQVSYDDLNSNSTHEVYYLDQFSFNIP